MPAEGSVPGELGLQSKNESRKMADRCLQEDLRDRNATAVGAYQMEVETAALVRKRLNCTFCFLYTYLRHFFPSPVASNLV